MPNISVLSDDIRNLIAAGEVVERPSSVVKELVENAIDAGAHEIVVDVINGGLEEIVVTDDGCGMDREDMALCIERHATSKLKSADDLADIKTMGFRGEALPSIAQISKMSIESRPKNSLNESGYILEVEAGNIKRFEEKGLSVGTKITVADIFYNVPARKKFAKTARTELGHIKDMVQRLALANPEIRFKLTSDGKEIISAYTIGDPKQRAFEIFGSEKVKKSFSCEADAGEVRVYGLVGDPSTAADGTRGIYWFVNRRPVRDRLLNHAINEAYRSLLPKGTSPFSMLFITMMPELVDVNVHPTKSEVRFLRGNAVHDFVMNAVKRALSGRESRESKNEEVPFILSRSKGGRFSSSTGSERTGYPLSARGESQSIPTDILLPTGPFSSLKVIGQLHNSFLLCEKEGGTLVVIDQHATHERIGYEKLKEGYKTSEIQSQKLLIPDVITVPSKTVGYLEEAVTDLNKIGWEIEPFGGDEFCVKAVPAILGNINLKNVVSSLAEDLTEYGKMDSIEEKLDLLMKVTACHAQVRAGDRLSNTEIEHLLREMDRYDWSGRCPHGRPAVAEVALKEIAKWFDRT